MQIPPLCSNLPQTNKTILRWVIDGNLMLLEGAIDGEEIIEIDEGLAEVDLIVDYY